ncbi:unnamed protein product [Discula destructiva]
MRASPLVQAALVLLATGVVAHPGETHPTKVDPSVAQLKGSVRRGLGSCAAALEKRGIPARNIARREAFVKEQRRKRSIAEAPHRRQVELNPDIVNDTSHLSTAGYTPSTPESTIFESSTCALSPDGETGPYFIPGQLVRSDILEGEAGVPLYIEIQLIDVNTCNPVVGEYLEIWNCNATGVYSGVVGAGNGNSADLLNADATFLRGLQATDSEGVASFSTLFPGHYSGRANHVHIAAHVNATLLANNTVTGGGYDHIGQLFWDQDLIDQIEASAPYVTNTIAKTKNVDDGVFITEAENTTLSPVAEYEYMGASLSDGLFAWITVGINGTAVDDPNYSYVWTANGTISAAHGENTGSPGWSQIGDWD